MEEEEKILNEIGADRKQQGLITENHREDISLLPKSGAFGGKSNSVPMDKKKQQTQNTNGTQGSPLLKKDDKQKGSNQIGDIDDYKELLQKITSL